MAHSNLDYLLLTSRSNLRGAAAAYDAAVAIDASHALARAGKLYAQAGLAEQGGAGLAAVAAQYEEAERSGLGRGAWLGARGYPNGHGGGGEVEVAALRLP